MRIMGVDTSTKTGYVIMDEDGEVFKVGVLHHKPCPNRFERFEQYELDLLHLITMYEVDLVMIEGYAYAGKFNNSLQYELGACIRMMLHKQDVIFVEVAPTGLKKFVTGKGNAKKDLMLLGVYKRWEFDTEDDNEADAYGLAQFGRAMIGEPTGVPVVNFTAVETVLASDQPGCKQLQS